MSKLEHIRKLIVRHKAIIIYLIFGGLTTLVNFLVYFPLYNCLSVSAAVSNIIAWLVAVVFAFFTNKPFVFHSTAWSLRLVVPEFLKFFGCRLGSGLIETGAVWLFVDYFAFNGNLIKVLVSIMVIILNYLTSKFLVFLK